MSDPDLDRYRITSAHFACDAPPANGPSEPIIRYMNYILMKMREEHHASFDIYEYIQAEMLLNVGDKPVPRPYVITVNYYPNNTGKHPSIMGRELEPYAHRVQFKYLEPTFEQAETLEGKPHCLAGILNHCVIC